MAFLILEGFADAVAQLRERAAIVRACRESGDWSALDAFDEAFGFKEKRE